MLVHQRNLVQTVAIWAGLAGFGVFLGFLSVYSLGFPAIAAVVGGWMVFWVVMNTVARRVGWRAVVLFLAGVPLALLLSLTHTLTDLINPWISIGGNPSVAIFFWTLCLWSAVCGLLTGSARGMYVALHLCNWLFWLGYVSVYGWQGVPLLLIPLSVMLLLLGFSRPLIRKLAVLPLFPKSWRSEAAPKSDDPGGYEHGYQPVYQKGGNIYTIASDERDMPPVSSPQAEMHQHE